MFQRTMHVFLGTTFVIFLTIQSAWAVSFGKMDVASKMGEPFYAEVPLRLGANESIRKTSVELGSPADYRILEVYRDKVVGSIRTDIVDDERGPRVTLSSEAAIDKAFFNLVLKVRYGRSTHYKKIPVFLDVPSVSVATSAAKTPIVPAVDVANVLPDSSEAFVTKVPEGKKEAKEAFDDVEAKTAVESADPKVFAGWARTSRYGPMVYGDTITTVAKRLRVDDQFSNQQVMVALFEKNKSQFSKENINLIKAGAFLDVPTAAEVATLSPAQAKQVLAEQTKVWKAMQSQPKYAALAEAQRNRYSSRVRIGDAATGVASKPVVATPNTEPKSATTVAKTSKVAKALEKQLQQKDTELTALQQKMADLEGRLAKAEKKASATPQNASINNDANTAALDAQNKRLELVITRLKNQLEQAKSNVAEDSGFASWMMYALIGLGGLVLALLVAVLLLLRKGREHPAEKEEALEEAGLVSDAEADTGVDATKVMNADEFEMPTAAPEEDSHADAFGTDDDLLEEIPDLTDEETGEMEPFNPDGDETPDPNVNYLEDADVYMRYGMEEEAEKQVRMALKLDPESPEAHAKMVQIQRSKGDEDAANNAVAAAKVALAGGALTAFEASLGAENLDSTGVPQSAVESLDGLANESIEMPVVEDVMSASDNDTADLDFDFSDMSVGEDAVDSIDVAEDAVSSNDSADIDFDGIDVDFDMVDLSETSEQESSSDEIVSLDSVDSSELDSIDVDFESIEVAAADTGDLDLSEFGVDDTAEVQLDSGTLMVSQDDIAEEQEAGLNDYEIEKARQDKEAEENAVSVELDDSEDDPFAAASASLDEKESESTSEDWDMASVGTLDGEEVDPLSLIEDSKEELLEDGTADVSLEDLDVDLDLSDLDTIEDNSSEEVVVESTDDSAVDLDVAATDDSGLEDLDMDFDLPDLDTLADNSSEEVMVESADDSAVDLDVAATDDSGLEDLDMDFDLPDLDTLADNSSEEVMVESADDSAVDLDVAATDDLGLEDLDMDFDLPDLDTLEDNSSEEVVVESADDSAVDLDVAATDDSGLEDLDMDLDLPDFDTGSFDEVAEVSLDDAESVSLDDLDMDFELPNFDSADENDSIEVSTDSTHDLDVSMVDDSGLEELNFEIPDLGEDSDLDSLDSGLDDLDISTTSIDPTKLGGEDPDVEGLDLESDLNEEDLDIFAELDQDLSDLEESIVSNVQDLGAVDDALDIQDLDIDGIDVSTDPLAEPDELDSTFILNPSSDAKTEPEVEIEEPTHFANIDDAMQDSTLVMNAKKDPMTPDFSATAELDDIHHTIDSIDSLHDEAVDPMVATFGASQELDDLMKDLDGLLDSEDKDKS